MVALGPAALLLAACLGAGPDGKNSRPAGKSPKEPFEAFQVRIGLRKRQIMAELKAGPREPWEGVFDDGAGFGPSRSWIISRKAGYVSTSRMIDMGRVEVEGDRIALVSESPTKPWGLKPLVYVVVPWGERVYLVQDDRLLSFCNDVNAGRLRRPEPTGLYPLRVGGSEKKVAGLPRVPEEYKQYLLKKSIRATVMKVEGEKQDVAVLGVHYLMDGVALKVNVGKRDGVRSGMRFYREPLDDAGLREEFVVISVRAKECEVLASGVSKGTKKRPRAGMKLTTADPVWESD